MLYLRSFNRFVLISLALLGLSVSSVNAATVLTNPNQFSGSETLLTFEGTGLNGGDAITDLGGVNFALSDAGGAVFRNDGGLKEFGPQGTGAIDNLRGASPFLDMTLTFGDKVNRVGFEMRTNGPDDIDLTMLLSLGGQLVDQLHLTTPVGVAFKFYAFETAVLFDTLVIDVDEVFDGAFRMDNLRFENASVVPVPAAVWLFGTALVGFVGMSRRRKVA